MQGNSNLNILSTKELLSPFEIKNQFPIDRNITNTVIDGRNTIADILYKQDDRFLMIVGPCSIHDSDVALDYANRFAKLREEVKNKIELVMRVYFEKPRTTIGWKGLITDPYLNGKEDVVEGLKHARKILIDINALAIPCATELLDPIVPQYISDLVSWGAIGARTCESQIHRMMASGLDMPIGFKNNTEGNIEVAIDALETVKNPHSFLGISEKGNSAVIKTKGNLNCHIILRGGRSGQNFSNEYIHKTKNLLNKRKLTDSIMVDCSHANSNKQYEKQVEVFNNILDQRVSGNKNIIGVMLESNLNPGNQKLTENINSLEYGVSITDPCIGWYTTEEIIRKANQKL